MLLASCSYEEAKKYNSKIVLVSEEESNKKPIEVLLNIVTSEPDEVIKEGIGVAKCITTDVSPKSCPSNFSGNVFRIYKYGDDLSNIENEVEGVVPLLVLPDDFSNMRVVDDIMKEYPRVRVTGGNLLEIPGFRIGRYDKGKEKMSSVFNGVYDIFKEVNLEDIKVQRVMSKVRAKSSSKSGSSAPKKSASKAKKAETFAKFFGSGNNAF